MVISLSHGVSQQRSYHQHAHNGIPVVTPSQHVVSLVFANLCKLLQKTSDHCKTNNYHVPPDCLFVSHLVLNSS